MTQTLPLTMILGATHTGKAIGYRVLNLNRTVYSAFTTTGVGESATIPGTYYVSGGISAPDAGGHIVVGTAIEDLREQTIESALLVDKAGFRDAFGMAAADMDAQLAALPSDIDTLLTAEHGAGLWTNSTGTGDIMFPYQVTDAGMNPIIGAKVIVTTDINGNNRVAMDFTDEFGYARFHLAAGLYYFWTYRAGYQVSRADVEVVP